MMWTPSTLESNGPSVPMTRPTTLISLSLSHSLGMFFVDTDCDNDCDFHSMLPLACLPIDVSSSHRNCPAGDMVSNICLSDSGNNPLSVATLHGHFDQETECVQ